MGRISLRCFFGNHRCHFLKASGGQIDALTDNRHCERTAESQEKSGRKKQRGGEQNTAGCSKLLSQSVRGQLHG